MGVLSDESVSTPAAGFADGIEFEETFPESEPAPQTETAPRLTLVRSDPEPAEPGTDAIEALYQEQLDRRLREAEALVKQTIERLRLDEEQRLVDWIRARREEEERRLEEWVEERRTAVERSMEERRSDEDQLAARIEGMLAEWQARFEQRLEQRRVDEERAAEHRRVSDEERLRAWRTELEQALADRLEDRRVVESPPVPVGRPEAVRSPFEDAVAQAASARDVGRILRDVLSELAHSSAFALSLHHAQRDEVAYRYRVASDDELGALLRRETLDDGPDSAAAHMDGWVRAHRAARVGSHNALVHTAQVALREGDATLGVLTLQTEGEPLADNLLARVGDLTRVATPRLAELRARGAFRGV